MVLLSILVVLIGVLISCYFLVKQRYTYWSNHGIPFVTPTFPYGNFKVFGKRDHPALQVNRIYKQLKCSGPIGGFFVFITPIVLCLDLNIIRNILIKDFQFFQDRGLYYNEKDDPLSAHLFNLEPARWKLLRSKITPAFTSGKMKFMFPTIAAVANEFKKCLNDLITGEEMVEMQDLLGRFITDVIGSCVFGIECNSLKDPEAKFHKMGKKVFGEPKLNGFQRLLTIISKPLARTLKIKSNHEDVSTFFLETVKENIAYREKNNVQRNDFMDLLIQLKNEGCLKDESLNKVGHLSILEIAAQAYVFFIAGFETSSTTLTYCLYELALNKDIQNRARDEVNSVLEKYNGNLTYEALNEMVYCEQIVSESLRKYPPANHIRVATKDYKIPESNYTIKRGMMVLVPVYAIHHDPEIYKNPEEFNPDRFSPEEIKKRPSCSFLAFGDGPRNCIGLRFGMLQVRIGLVTLIKNFEFSICNKTDIPVEFSYKGLVLLPKNNMWLNVKPLN